MTEEVDKTEENKKIRQILIEECLKEENVYYEMKIEERWLERYKEASKYYQVYCLYVNENNLDKVKQFIKDYENATIITDGIEELKNIEGEKDDNRFKIFTKKKFLKYYYVAMIIVGILIIMAIKFTL